MSDEGTKELKYMLLQSVSTPFGFWERGTIMPESYWRSIAPNSASLVSLDSLDTDFVRVMDNYAEVRDIEGAPKLVIGKQAWYNAFITDAVNREDIMHLKREAIQELEKACSEYLKRTQP